MATTRIKDLSKTATTVNSDANLVLDGNTGGTQKISRDNFRQDTADAFVAAPGTYNLAPLNSGTGKIDAVYLSSSSDTPKGAWDASTNTPTLADGSGTAGDYYDVTVAGSSDLGSGSIAFTVGDVVKYNGTVWFKIDSVANILDGVSTIDGAKTAIEIPDVGTGPSQVPLNQHLGTMAYQDADGVSIAKLEVTDSVTDSLTIENDTAPTLYFERAGIPNAHIKAVDENGTEGGGIQLYSSEVRLRTGGTERVRIDSSGKVGIGTASPKGELMVKGTQYIDYGDGGATGGGSLRMSSSAVNSFIASNNYYLSGAYNKFARDGGSSQIQFDTQTGASAGNIIFSTVGSGAADSNVVYGERLRITNTALVMGSGVGIDFGSVTTSAGDGTGTTGSVSNSVLSDYEYGSWTPTFAPSGGSFASITMDVQSATYVKVGRMVHCQAYIRTDGLDTTGASGSVRVTGLPFVNSGSSNYAAVSVGLSRNWVTNPAGGYVNNGVASLTLTKRTTSSTELIEMEPADMTTGSGTDKNAVLMSFQYIAST